MGEKKYIKQPGGGGTVVPPSVVDVAIFQEFGTVAQVTPAMRNWFKGQGVKLSPSTTEIRNPARSFVRSSIDENYNEIVKVIDNQTFKLMMGRTNITKALKLIGAYVQSLIQVRIETGTYTPLSDFTIEKKKSSKPLIDTGRLRQSVAYEVRFK